MKTIQKLLGIAALFVASSAFSQETTTNQGLSLGQTAAPEISQEVIGDWTLNCSKRGEVETCELFQLLKQANGAPAVAVTLYPIKDDSPAVAGGNFIAPLETLLTAQMSIAVDENLPRVYPYAFCNANGCVSRVGLTADDLASYKKGTAATVAIVPAAQPDRLVQVTMSLNGFTKAFDTALSKLPQ